MARKGTTILILILFCGAAYGALEDDASKSAARNTGRVFIIGGDATDQGGPYLASVEIFDAQRKVFLRDEEGSATRMTTGRAHLGAAAVGSFLYAIGGWDASDNVSAKVERLNVDERPQATWQTCAPMPTARRWVAVASSSTTIFALGGYSGSGDLDTVEAFDSTMQTWSRLRAMPTARNALASVVIGDFLYAVGGTSAAAGRLNVVEKYQIASGEWSTTAPMHAVRASPCAAMLDGKLYALGGWDGAAALSSAEVYTPSTNMWTRVADMSIRRSSCGAAAIGGLIVVFGGHDGSGYSDSVEVYNATADAWHTLAAKMKVARGFFGIASIP